MCFVCEADMPRGENTPFHDNAMHYVLASTMPVERCATWFRYKKGSPYTNLVLEAKYNNRPALARYIGYRLGAEIVCQGFFDAVDALVPVPLSTWKMMRRGFNQSAYVARGLSSHTGLPVLNLLRAREHSTQTLKSAAGRRLNAGGVYRVRRQGIPPEIKHVVLVDDVITTGSTMIECIGALKGARKDLRVSVVSAALTDGL